VDGGLETRRIGEDSVLETLWRMFFTEKVVKVGVHTVVGNSDVPTRSNSKEEEPLKLL